MRIKIEFLHISFTLLLLLPADRKRKKNSITIMHLKNIITFPFHLWFVISCCTLCLRAMFRGDLSPIIMEGNIHIIEMRILAFAFNGTVPPTHTHVFTYHDVGKTALALESESDKKEKDDDDNNYASTQPHHKYRIIIIIITIFLCFYFQPDNYRLLFLHITTTHICIGSKRQEVGWIQISSPAHTFF